MTAEQNPAVTGARIREPAGFWEWCAAVDELAQEDGVQATAHAWALHCVSWKGDQCRLRTPHVGVEELARRRRRDRTAIRRHLVALEDLGLLELVQRHGHGRKRLYLARVPIGYGAPGAPVPLPGLEGATYRAAAPGNPETLTGQQRPVIPGSSARFSFYTEFSDLLQRDRPRVTGQQRPVARAGGGGEPRRRSEPRGARSAPRKGAGGDGPG